MPKTLLGHQRHAFLNALVEMGTDDPARHNLVDARGVRRLALQDNLPRVIPFGNDTHKGCAFHDKQRPYLLLCHEVNGVKHGGVRGNGPELMALGIQNLLDCLHGHSFLTGHMRYRGVTAIAAVEENREDGPVGRVASLGIFHLTPICGVFTRKKRS